jgi:hypothetical protein
MVQLATLWLMRPLLAGAATRLAERTTCLTAIASFESLARIGERLEGTRGKLLSRCLPLWLACRLAVLYPFNSHLLAGV